MRTYQLLFALLILMCGVVLFLGTLDEVPSQRGLPHSDFSTMQQGGDPAARHSEVLWIAWVFGALIIAFKTALIDVSLMRGGKSGPASARRTVWICGGILELIFLALIMSYSSFMADPLQETVLSFPKPTAWMMYGIWGFPMVFVLLYVRRFEQWILNPADEAEFAILEKSRDAERAAAASQGGHS